MFGWNDCGNKKSKTRRIKNCFGHFGCVQILVSESVHFFVLDSGDVSATIVRITSEVGYRDGSQEMNPRAAPFLLQQQSINNSLYWQFEITVLHISWASELFFLSVRIDQDMLKRISCCQKESNNTDTNSTLNHRRSFSAFPQVFAPC